MSEYLIKFSLHGVQDYIFDIQLNKSAAKRLKGRSAFVTLVAKDVLNELKSKSKEDIEEILVGGAKFLIKGEYEEDELKKFKKKIQEEIFEKFNGELKCSFAFVDMQDKDFSKLRDKLNRQISIDKYQSFLSTYSKKDELTVDYENFIKPHNQEENRRIGDVCKGCNKWLVNKNNNYVLKKYGYSNENKNLTDLEEQFSNGICDHCAKDIILVKRLIKDKELESKEKDIIEGLLPYDNNIENIIDELSDEIGYISKKDGAIKDFETIAGKENNDKGDYNKLAVLKGDIDNLGDLTSDLGEEKLNNFSNNLSTFFNVELYSLLKKLGKEKKDYYTLYAGGDDFVVIGKWNDIIDLTVKLKDKFNNYAEKNLEPIVEKEITFSVGIQLFNPKEKIYGVIEKSENALEKAKEIDKDKNGITFLGESMKYDKFIDLKKLGDKIYKEYGDIVSDGYWHFLLNITKKKEKNIKYQSVLIDSLSRNYMEQKSNNLDIKKQLKFVFTINSLFNLGFEDGFENKAKELYDDYSDSIKKTDIEPINKLKELFIYILMLQQDEK